MILVDANVLLYAYDSSSRHHEACRTWLERALSGSDDVRFGLVTVLAFVRISTNPTVFQRPLATDSAIEIARTWLARPNAALATPTERHWDILRDLAVAGQARGPLVMDAHLAALAIEHGATLATSDRDFSRFSSLRTIDPTAG